MSKACQLAKRNAGRSLPDADMPLPRKQASAQSRQAVPRGLSHKVERLKASWAWWTTGRDQRLMR